MIIDTANLEQSSEKIEVKPSNNIFFELGKTTYDLKDLLSELVDNVLAARIIGKELTVKIDIYVDEHGNPTDLVVKDNAGGIPKECLGDAITPAGTQTKDSLNEHGLGMKQAVAALGELNYLATKTREEEKARLVKEFKYGILDTYHLPKFEYDSGTEIAITNVKPIVVVNSNYAIRKLVLYLGARYRRFLKPENKILDLTINIISNLDGSKDTFPVVEIKPIYFHPSTRTNKPVIWEHIISNGLKWSAKLTFGYAPKDDECSELGLEPLKNYQPYSISLPKQGLDIIFQDRVILFNQLSELGIVNVRHSDYNTVRGEIVLLNGFSTAITKNSMVADENFIQCIGKIKGILEGKLEGPNKRRKNYLNVKTYPDEIPERLLRDRLVTYLRNNPLAKREDIQTEYVIDGIESRIDICADGEAWEIKTGIADALDVYQLFMYMDFGDINKGYLVAKDFANGAYVASDFINNKHQKNIELTKLEAFPINHPLSQEERDRY